MQFVLIDLGMGFIWRNHPEWNNSLHRFRIQHTASYTNQSPQKQKHLEDPPGEDM